jgi:hypothetical protein
MLGVILACSMPAKEKFGMAVWSILVPVVGLVGSISAAKPHSVWAKLFYRHGEQERSEQRYSGKRGSRSGSGEASYSLGSGSAPSGARGT